MKTLRRLKVRDQAAEEIKQYIVGHHLAPGDRLPTEQQLAEKLGISRLSVREATKSLEFLGIIEAKTGVGLTVGRIDMGRVTQHLGFHPGLLDADPIQLIDTRLILEVGVLPHVVKRMRKDEFIEHRLRALVDQFRLAKNVKSWIAIDIEFHQSLIEASGLEPLAAFGDLLRLFFQRFRESVKKAEWRESIESHSRLVDFLTDGDVTTATKELRRHINSHKERL